MLPRAKPGADIALASLFSDRYIMRVGRPRTFDADDVVSAAMACFRERGYEASSIRDLEAVTGLRAPSLYQAFGDKAAFFAIVLASYTQVVMQRRVETYLGPSAGVDGIRAFFTSSYTTEPEPAHGCLLANSAIEYPALDTDARFLVDAGLELLRAAFARVIEQGRRAAEIDRRVDPHVAAQVLVTLFEGQLLLQRTDQRAVDPSAVIDAALASLLPPPTPNRQTPNRQTPNRQTPTRRKHR
jgi:AcrR family transcriptional regulator